MRFLKKIAQAKTVLPKLKFGKNSPEMHNAGLVAELK